MFVRRVDAGEKVPKNDKIYGVEGVFAIFVIVSQMERGVNDANIGKVYKDSECF